MKPPKFTIYGQRQGGKWINTCHYFADTELEALAIYNELKKECYVAGYRLWTPDDFCYMGVLDRQEIQQANWSDEARARLRE